MVLTIDDLKSQYKSYSNPLDKIKRECERETLYRLVKGLYETDITTDSYLLAGWIIDPSYISFEWALSFYNLIPEKVVAITSATENKRKNHSYKNIFGRFEYSDIPSSCFIYGITIIEKGRYKAKIAKREKAICDCLYKWPVCKSIKQLKIMLFDDKRIDENEFKKLDFKLLNELAIKYKRTNLKLLIKMIQKEYMR